MDADLLKRVSTAIAWGTPDNESLGMTHGELISLLSECHRAMSNPLPKAPPVPPIEHDEITMPTPNEEQAALLESTRKLLAARTKEAADFLTERNKAVTRCRIAEAELARRVSSGETSDELRRRLAKMEKHMDAMKEILGG